MGREGEERERDRERETNSPLSSTRINCLSFIFSLGSLYLIRQSFNLEINPFNLGLLCSVKEHAI